MFNSIRSKFTLWYTLITALMVCVFAIISYFLLYFNLVNNLKNNLTQFSSKIINEYVALDEKNNLLINTSENETKLSDELRSESLSLRITDQEKNIITQLGLFKTQIKLSPSKINSALVVGNENIDFILDNEGKNNLYLISPIVKNDKIVGAVELSQPVANSLEALNQLSLILILGILISIAISVFMGYYLGKRILSYIDELVDNVEAITVSQDLDKRLPVPVQYQDELTRLATTFNHMLDKIRRELNREKNFTANVSHDLRTPLTIIQGNVDLALKKKSFTPGQMSKTLYTIKDETKRMSAIIQELLSISSIEKEQASSYVSVNIPEVLDEIITKLQDKLNEKKIQIVYKQNNQSQSYNIFGHPQHLKRLFQNVLENSIKYNNASGKIIIKVSGLGNKIIVLIQDTGIGIKENDLPYIFDRHWQSRKSRTGISQGFGLGLAIAKEIVKIHQGEISATSISGKGTKIRIVFPQKI